MDTYIGLDYGGTKLLIGEVDGQGRLLASRRYDTGRKTQEEAAAYLTECLRDYREKESFQGTPVAAGTGIIGISHREKGIWHSMNHKEGADIPLAAMVSQILQVPAAIDNDVRSSTTAELLWGIGKCSRNFVYISVGTGLAAGIVCEGRILRGANQNAGEIGHSLVKASSHRQCICGKTGCAELSASGLGMTENMRSRGGGCMPAREILEKSRQGDSLCRAVREEAEIVLGQVIENLVRTVDPDTVVLGGGIMQDSFFYEGVKSRLHPATMRGVTGGVRLSSLHPARAGVLGAAAVAKEYIGLEKEKIQ